MSGKRVFSILCRLHIVEMTFLFAYLTVSGAIDPHEPSAPKQQQQQQQPPPNPPPSNSSSGSQPKPKDAAPQHYSAVDGPDDQLPYIFILQLPGLIAEEPTWSKWSQWSPCGTNCGATPGRSVRRRHCQGATESACKGESTQWRNCKIVPCSPKEKPSEPSAAAPEVERKSDSTVVAPVEGGKQMESGKVEATMSVERHGGGGGEAAARIGGADREKKPDDEEQRYGIAASDVREWHNCVSPCPYKIQLRRRWCYLGDYCLGAAQEIRVCGSAANGALGACGTVNTTDILEFGEPRNQSSPWTDPHIGWSHWTPWVSCDTVCDLEIQTVNWSTPCLSPVGLTLTNCHGQYELVRVCREQFDFSTSTPYIVCGQVENFEHWRMVDDTSAKHRYFFPSSSRLIHAIVLFVLFAPPIVLLFYWLVSRARKPRYESLPSAPPNGDSAVDSNGHPTISADVTSALGPNHLTIETDPNAWKTV